MTRFPDTESFAEPPMTPHSGSPSVHVDCDTCAVRGPACGDCVVAVLLGPPPERLHLDRDELSALDALAGAGLVPPIRLVRAEDPPPDDEHGPDPARA